MKLTHTQGIVLKTIKYGESSLISHCFTKDFGMVSYLMKGILKPSRKGVRASFFQPLSQLNIIATHRSASSLQYPREVQLCHRYTSLHTDWIKNAQVYFLSDICHNVLFGEPANASLFHFLQKEFLLLDELEISPNFHLRFLLDLTEFLGFYPSEFQNDAECFFLEDGHFGYYKTEHKPAIIGETFGLFSQLLTLAKEDALHLKMNQRQRQELLQHLLDYYRWHSPNFKTPDSLNILGSLFL